MKLIAALPAVIVTILVPEAPRLAAQRPPDPIVQALDAYAAGRYDEALAQIRAVRNGEDVLNRLKDDIPKWVEAASPEMRERRRRVAATVALEAAHVDVARAVIIGGSGGRALVRGSEILEVGCKLLRQDPPSQFERLWMLASVALQSYPHGPEWLEGDNVPRPADGLLNWPERRHLEEAVLRFPEEPRFALAAVMAHPAPRARPNRPGISAIFMIDRSGYEDAAFVRKHEAEAASYVQTAIDGLSKLVGVPGVGAEAQVRRGIIWYHRANLAESLRDAQAGAASADDPEVAYMGHLYAGMTLDNLNRRAEAVDAYGAALRRVPNAHSGVMSLAADLLLLDQRSEAASLVERAFAAPGPADPWRTFSLGDYRLWPGYLARLREAVRP